MTIPALVTALRQFAPDSIGKSLLATWFLMVSLAFPMSANAAVEIIQDNRGWCSELVQIWIRDYERPFYMKVDPINPVVTTPHTGTDLEGFNFVEYTSSYHFRITDSIQGGGYHPCSESLVVRDTQRQANQSFSSSSTPQAPAQQCGSIVQVDNKVLGESISIAGTPFALTYMSDRVPGRVRNYSAVVEVTGSPTPPLSTFVARLEVAGKTYLSPPYQGDRQTHKFVWDGKNAAGQYTLGGATATITVTETDSNGILQPPRVTQRPLGTLRAVRLGFGGWTPSVYHFYDVGTRTLYRGDGSASEVDGQPYLTGQWLVAEADGTRVYIFDSLGKHLETKTAVTGRTILRFKYVRGVVASIVLPFGKTVLFNRDADNNLLSITGTNGELTQIGLTDGYLSHVTNANGETWSMACGADGLLTSFQKPGGQQSVFSFDGDGLLLSDLHSGGAATVLSDSNQQVTSTSALGRVRSYTILDAPESTGAVPGQAFYYRRSYFPDGAFESLESTNTLNADGEVTARILNQVMPTNGTRWTYGVPDARWGMMAPFNARQGQNDWFFDRSQTINLSDPSNPFSIVDWTITETNPKEDSTTTTYTASNRTYIASSPLGRQRTIQTDVYERIIKLRRGTEAPIRFTWTNEHLGSIEQAGRVTTFEYHPITGRLEREIDALNQQTRFTYDAVGRVAELIRNDNQTIRFEYDLNGNLASITPAGRSLHSFEIDALEMPASYTPPSLPDVVNPTTTFLWNPDRQLTLITRPNGGTISYGYVAHSGALASIGTAEGNYAVQQTVPGLLYSVTSPSNIYTRFSYDQFGRPIGELVSRLGGSPLELGEFTRLFGTEGNKPDSDTVTSGNGATQLSVAYSYDDDGLLTGAGALALTRHSKTGRIVRSKLGKIVDDYEYNTVGELIGYVARYAGTPIYQLALARDAIGRIQSRTETLDGVTTTLGYSYDDVGRLTFVTRDGIDWQSYAYDSNGNRVGGIINGQPTTASYDAQDRLIAFNDSTYSFNANGEVTGKNSPGGSATQYSHDTFGQLKQVVLPGGLQVRYVTDGLNRRVARLEANATTSRYLYMDALRVVAETTAGGVIRKRFVYGTKSNVPDYLLTPSGAAYRIISDDLGSPRMVVHVGSGAVVQIMQHDPFGQLLRDSSPGYQPFGFAGGLYDKDTKLVRFGAREYDAAVGRWISKDPVLFDGGDANLYGYVLNDPVNYFDDAGTRPISTRGRSGSRSGTIANLGDMFDDKPPAGYFLGCALSEYFAGAQTCPEGPFLLRTPRGEPPSPPAPLPAPTPPPGGCNPLFQSCPPPPNIGGKCSNPSSQANAPAMGLR